MIEPARFKIAIRTALPLLALVLLAVPAQAFEREPYSLEVLVDGEPLVEYRSRGKSYIEALEGREYSIRLTNHTGRRIAVALSVDGLNTIDAKTTSTRKASKWILGPYETITLRGWQTSTSTARRFFFTTEEKSYGAWLGSTSNLGVITAAVFRERRPVPAPIVQPDRRESGSQRRREHRKQRDSRETPAPAAPAERMEYGRDGGDESSSARSSEPIETESRLSDRLAATGIGRQQQHRVRRVHFEAEASPAAVIELRYEYHDALVRLGVLPQPYARHEDPLQRRERARGFEDVEFAPDPHR